MSILSVKIKLEANEVNCLEVYRKSDTCTKVPGHHICAGSTTYFLSSPGQPC
ncbi:smoothelin-like protein 2-like protein [Corchorus olitorius]|uniref:Smoothelin-like protein 2-like protein n=1 Tax=Corchorus olitorius TaxID=93759 RepID=A0A1R3KZ54_9ROSI|nr:smoothelin-like protein 2-like protein [Corchorus olitorius]